MNRVLPTTAYTSAATQQMIHAANLAPGSYEVRVLTRDAAGISRTSVPMAVTLAAPPPPPPPQLPPKLMAATVVPRNQGIDVEVQHHEVGTAGQSEIDIRYGTLLQTADRVTLFKYVVKSTAWEFGKTVTFMPKPIFQDNGSGMHCHQGLWLDGKPLFYDETGYAGLSDMARYYMGGLLKHAPSLMAWAAPTTNSYRRLVPGYEAPVNLVYSQRNRSAAIRIPYVSSPKGRRIEVRFPDPTANPYLAFSAMLMAGLDGVMNKIQA